MLVCDTNRALHFDATSQFCCASRGSREFARNVPAAPADLHRANGVASLGAFSDTTRSAHRKTRIEREAFRDPVGDQVPTGKTTLKCSFSGVISIGPKRFLDSGIALVECPDCARMRSLSPRKGVLRFPSHDKRKIRTPNTDQRWVIGETAWEVVGG